MFEHMGRVGDGVGGIVDDTIAREPLGQVREEGSTDHSHGSHRNSLRLVRVDLGDSLVLNLILYQYFIYGSGDVYIAGVLGYGRSRKLFYVYFVLKTVTSMVCEGSVQCLAVAYAVRFFFRYAHRRLLTVLFYTFFSSS